MCPVSVEFSAECRQPRPRLTQSHSTCLFYYSSSQSDN